MYLFAHGNFAWTFPLLPDTHMHQCVTKPLLMHWGYIAITPEPSRVPFFLENLEKKVLRSLRQKSWACRTASRLLKTGTIIWTLLSFFWCFKSDECVVEGEEMQSSRYVFILGQAKYWYDTWAHLDRTGIRNDGHQLLMRSMPLLFREAHVTHTLNFG